MTRSMLVALLALTSLSACVSVTSDCPEPRVIDPLVQEQALKELQSLPNGSAIETVLAASLDDRDKLRACRKHR